MGASPERPSGARRSRSDIKTDNERRYRQLFDDVGMLAATVDRNGVIDHVNENGCRLLGMSSDEICGRHFTELLPEEYRATFQQEHEARMSGAHCSLPIDLPVLTANGELRVIHLQAAVLHSDDGEPAGAAVAGADITEHQRTEERYRQQVEEFDAVFRMLKDLYFRLDAEGRIEEYRAPDEALLYASAEHFLGKTLEEALPPDVSFVLRTEFERCRACGEMTVAEYALEVMGENREWEARFLPLAHDRVAVVVRDVTVRKRNEQKVREQRDFLDLLLETLDSGVIVTKGGHPPVIQRANRLAAELIGHEPEEIVGKTTRVFHRSYAEWERFSEQARKVTEAGETGCYEVRMRRRDGTEFDAEVVVQALRVETADRIGIIRDITDRKAAERRVRNSEMRFRSIVEEAPFGLHLYELRDGHELVLTAANAAADLILRIDHGPLIGLTVEKAFPASAEAGWPRVYRRIADEGGNWQAEVPYNDGTVKGVFDVTVFQTSPGTVAVAFVDITERRAIAHADRMHQMKVSAMAAELSSAEDRERRRLAEELHDGVSQALAVTRMHLAAAVDDQGRLDRREFEDAVHMLEEAIRETRALTTKLYPPVLHELGLGPALRWLAEEFEMKHGLTCTVTVTDDDVTIGEESRNVLFRGARELLMNVVKHAGVDRAWVSLDVAGRYVVLTVADQGRGMDPANTKKSGFGLFSIRERLPHFGGSIDVESAPGRGTRVTITVPVGAI